MGCSDKVVVVPSLGGAPSTVNGWLVSSSQVYDGGPGKDGIPSIDAPKFTRASDVEFLSDEDLVLALRSDNVIKAYPHVILDWHEIVNDEIIISKFAVTYCPLTGTGIAWNRVLQGTETTFGVSGLLYNNNLMPYDRYTNSTWSQQRLDCVNGTLVGTSASTISLVETSFKSFKESFPQGQVLNTNTGFDRTYGDYPYGDYRENDGRFIFPLTRKDKRLRAKERVLGVILGKKGQRVYTFKEKGDDLELIRDEMAGTELVILRSVSKNLIVAFEDRGLGLSLIPNAFPKVLKDKNGATYDFLGGVIDDPGTASPLRLPTQFMGYWFSWGAFYPGIEISDL